MPIELTTPTSYRATLPGLELAMDRALDPRNEVIDDQIRALREAKVAFLQVEGTYQNRKLYVGDAPHVLARLMPSLRGQISRTKPHPDGRVYLKIFWMLNFESATAVSPEELKKVTYARR